MTEEEAENEAPGSWEPRAQPTPWTCASLGRGCIARTELLAPGKMRHPSSMVDSSWSGGFPS